eukprot:1678064-Pyramimonas_sp.AAC.1
MPWTCTERRREDAILIQCCTSLRLQWQGYSHAIANEDATNAFSSVSRDIMLDTLPVLNLRKMSRFNASGSFGAPA